MQSSSAIRLQIEDAVNPQRLVRDFRAILGKPRPTRRKSGGPLPVPKSRIGVPQFWHILVNRISERKWIRIRLYLAETRAPKGPSQSQTVGREFPGANGEIVANPPPIQATLLLALISAKDASILAHFSRSDVGLEMDQQ